MSSRILLIEDDPRLAEMVKNYLGGAGFYVTVAAKGQTGITALARDSYDALILDLMLPDMDGLDVCRRIRDKSDTPILMLTARGDAMDRVVGLELGAERLSAQAVRAARTAGAAASHPAAWHQPPHGGHAALRPAGDRYRCA